MSLQSPAPSLSSSIPFSPVPSLVSSSVSPTELERRFNVSVRWIQDRTIDFPVKPTTSQQLKFYGLYKQATLGDCNTPAPSVFNPVRRYMHAAHVKQKGKPKQQAMVEYLERLEDLIRDVDFAALPSGQRALAEKFFKEYYGEEEKKKNEEKQAKKEEEESKEETARVLSPLGPLTGPLSPIAPIASPSALATPVAQFQDEDQASPVRVSATHASASSPKPLEESKESISSNASLSLTGRFDEEANRRDSVSAKLSSLQAANHEKLKQVEQHLLQLVQKTQNLHTPQTSQNSSVAAASAAVAQAATAPLAEPNSAMKFSTPYTQRRPPIAASTPFSTQAAQRVGQLQSELTQLLQSLEQRTAKQENQLKQTEEKWQQRLDAIQGMQLEVMNKLQGMENRSDSDEKSDSGFSILGLASILIPVGLGAWVTYKWIQEKKRR